MDAVIGWLIFGLIAAGAALLWERSGSTNVTVDASPEDVLDLAVERLTGWGWQLDSRRQGEAVFSTETGPGWGCGLWLALFLVLPGAVYVAGTIGDATMRVRARPSAIRRGGSYVSIGWSRRKFGSDGGALRLALSGVDMRSRTMSVQPADARAVAAGPPAPSDTPAAVAAGVEPAGARCIRCAAKLDTGLSRCPNCQASLIVSRGDREAGVAFLLNELRGDALSVPIDPDLRARLIDRYEREIRDLLDPTSRYVPQRLLPEPPPPPRPAPAQPTAASVPVAAPGPARTTKPPRPPRPPRDWSWLVEQQASLLLFAGAFLVVVAGAIGASVSGGGMLKLGLFVAGDVAFLLAGFACLRRPRVVLAGRVFFAIGSLGVPLNFAIARAAPAGEDVDPEVMWLAASALSAVFFTAVALLGVGRVYAYGAGVALVNAVIAAIVVTKVTGEWVPVGLLALALPMSMTGIAGPRLARERLGQSWDQQALLLLGGASIGALAVTGVADGVARWSFPSAAAMAAAGFAVQTAGWKRRFGVSGTAGAVTALAAGLVYAIGWSLEYHAVAFTVAALALLAFVRRAMPRVPGRWLEATAAPDAALVAQGAAWTGIGVASGCAIAGASGTGFDPQTSWFLLATFALAAAFFALYTAGQLPLAGPADRVAASGAGLATIGWAAAIVYGLEANPEYYSLASVAAALPIGAAGTWVVPRLRGAASLPRLDRDAFLLANLSALAGVAVALGAAWAGGETGYEPQTRWFLAGAFALAMAFFAMLLLARARPAPELTSVPLAGLMLSFLGLAGAAAYGLSAGVDAYAVAFAAGGSLLVAFTRWGLPRLPAYDPPFDLRGTGITIAQAGIWVGLLLATLAVEEPRIDYLPPWRWLTFLLGAAGYGVYITTPAAMLGKADRMATYGLGLSLTGLSASLIYELDTNEEYFAFSLMAAAIVLFATTHWLLPLLRPRPAVPDLDLDTFVLGNTIATFALLSALGSVATLSDAGASEWWHGRWLLPAFFVPLGSYYAIQVGTRTQPIPGLAALPFLGSIASTLGMTHGVVYALEVQAEYHAFAALLPAVGLAAATLFGLPPVVERLLVKHWRRLVASGARTVTVAGVAVAVGAAVRGAVGDSYRPETGVFLPVAFAIAALSFALDAAGSERREIAAAVAVMLVGTAEGIVYAAGADPGFYGLAAVAAGLALELVAPAALRPRHHRRLSGRAGTDRAAPVPPGAGPGGQSCVHRGRRRRHDHDAVRAAGAGGRGGVPLRRAGRGGRLLHPQRRIAQAGSARDIHALPGPHRGTRALLRDQGRAHRGCARPGRRCPARDRFRDPAGARALVRLAGSRGALVGRGGTAAGLATGHRGCNSCPYAGGDTGPGTTARGSS